MARVPWLHFIIINIINDIATATAAIITIITIIRTIITIIPATYQRAEERGQQVLHFPAAPPPTQDGHNLSCGGSCIWAAARSRTTRSCGTSQAGWACTA